MEYTTRYSYNTLYKQLLIQTVFSTAERTNGGTFLNEMHILNKREFIHGCLETKKSQQMCLRQQQQLQQLQQLKQQHIT